MKTKGNLLLVAATAVLFVACGSETTDAGSGDNAPAPEKAPVMTAATIGDQTVLSVADYQAQSRYADADLDNGAAQAQICKACHSLNSGGANMIGPALHGFFGRGVGEQPGFRYSAAVSKASFFWTPEVLDAWLQQPGRFMPGNSMTFAGVMRQQDRDDLIAYLLQEVTAPPSGE